MLPTGDPDWASVDIAVPRLPLRLPGISMAGFRQRAPAPVNIAMVAHPSVTLLIDLSDGEGLAYETDGRHGHGSVVAGLLPGGLRTGGQVGECLQIRLEPALATGVFGAPDLTGTVASLRDLWGHGAEQAENALRAATSWDERFTLATDFLARRLGARSQVDPEIAHTWRRTLTHRGRVQINALADEVGWSRKRLLARFRAQLGITPKRAARLIRFDHAAHLLATGHAPATVAATTGYVDQPHLHREVKSFTGLTPSAVAVAPWLAIDQTTWPH